MFLYFFRGVRRKMLVPIYQDEDENCLRDLCISTIKESGNNSLTKDFENQTIKASI